MLTGGKPDYCHAALNRWMVPMLDWLKRYFATLRNSIQPIDESARPINEFMERVTKWWLDLIRNAMVVGAINALADRSDSLLLKVVGAVSIGALLTFATSRVHWYKFEFPTATTRRWEAFIANALGTGLTLILTLWLALNVGNAFRVLFEAVAAVKN